MMKYLAFLAIALSLSSCNLYIEEPEVVVMPQRHGWVYDTYYHQWVWTVVPYRY